MKRSNKIIFTGGGSGGHLMIMKGMIDYLNTQGFEALGYKRPEILIVGGRLGMIDDPGISLDEKLIPTFGLPYEFIRGGKLHRALKWATIKLLFGFLPGIFDSYKVIKRFDPDTIFATGGYVCLPMIIVGWFLRKKIVIHEQTLTAGLTNRIGGIFAHKILLTFEESKHYFANKKSIVTGNIVRDEVINPLCEISDLGHLVDSAKKRNKKIIYITGGSLGAHRINQFIVDHLLELCENYVLIWQTGDNRFHSDYQKYRLLVGDDRFQLLALEDKADYIVGNDVYITKFVRNEIGFIFQNADIVVARPGANTLYELAVLGKKAILIPLWVTSHSDQENNAVWYQNNFTGKIINEKDLNLENFQNTISQLIKSKSKKLYIDYKNISQKIWKEILYYSENH